MHQIFLYSYKLYNKVLISNSHHRNFQTLLTVTKPFPIHFTTLFRIYDSDCYQTNGIKCKSYSSVPKCNGMKNKIMGVVLRAVHKQNNNTYLLHWRTRIPLVYVNTYIVHSKKALPIQNTTTTILLKSQPCCLKYYEMHFNVGWYC